MDDNKENKKLELDTLMKNRPNIWGSSVGVLLIRIFAWILAVLCFGAGVYFLVLTLSNEADLTPIVDSINTETVKPIIAVFCLLLSMLLFFVVRMGKMLTERNTFILDIQEWNEEPKKDEDEKLSI